MYQIGDKVVHPMYGGGVVDSIVQKTVDGVVRDYYILKLPNRSMVVMVPTDNCEEIGVRRVVDQTQADQVMAAIPDIQVEMTANWNHRYRENMERMKSGDLLELTFGERVTRVKVLSVQEIVGKADAAGMYEEMR